MKSKMKETIITVISFSLLAAIAACNNGTQGAANSDSTQLHAIVDTANNKVKQATGKAEELANKAGSSIEEATSKNPDSTFVSEVAVSNYEELNMLQAGMDKGTSKTLKKYAKMMLAQHNDLKKKLEKYAVKNNYPVVADDMGKSQKALDEMNDKTGNDWDKAWAEKMFNAHEKAIGKFEGARKYVKDAELKSMIESTLPTLRLHLDMVKKLQAALKK